MFRQQLKTRFLSFWMLMMMRYVYSFWLCRLHYSGLVGWHDVRHCYPFKNRCRPNCKLYIMEQIGLTVLTIQLFSLSILFDISCPKLEYSRTKTLHVSSPVFLELRCVFLVWSNPELILGWNPTYGKSSNSCWVTRWERIACFP